MAGSRFNFLGKTGETAPASEVLADNNLSNNAAELSKYRFHARTMAKFHLCVNRSFGMKSTNPPINSLQEREMGKASICRLISYTELDKSA